MPLVSRLRLKAPPPMHGEAVGIGGGLGITPGVALAYLVVAGGLFWLSKSAASESYSSRPEMPVAAPAE